MKKIEINPITRLEGHGKIAIFLDDNGNVVKIAVMIMGLLGYANMWVAVFADTGVTLLCILYSVRLLRMKL